MLKNLRLGNRSLEWQLLLVFVLVTSILAWIGWNSYSDSQRYVRTETRVNLIHEQLRALNRFMLALQNTELGQRGFLLTSKPAYLEPYEDGLRRVNQELNNAHRLFDGETASQDKLASLRELKDARLEEMAETIALNRNGQHDEALAIVSTDNGKKTLDNIRAIIGNLQQQKRAEIDQIQQTLKSDHEASDRSLLMFLAAVVTFMLIAYTVLFQDLTERRRLKTRIAQAEHVDPLTGLSNFLYLNTALSNVLKHAYRDQVRVAALVIDLDNFKAINDQYGFDSGDKLLKTVAGRLKDMGRRNDLLARLSGDTFVMVVPHVPDVAEVQLLAERIIATLAPPLLPVMRDQYFGASIGIALYPDDAVDRQRLLRHAEEAVAKAKAEGKHRYRFYNDDLLLIVNHSDRLMNDLHRAVERNELFLHYQPQVDMQSGEIVGIEALVRWEHAEYGSISPDEFIPMAERSRLILPMGTWILREASRQAAEWNHRGNPWRVAVNVSAIELTAEDYPALVEDALRVSGLPAERLELEITERTLIEHAAMEALQEVRALGVQISLDDFGTGYSSLHYLARFPVHFIKIDKTFINGLPSDPLSVTLVNAMISMARELNIGVIAEGVETAEQAEFLRAAQCAMAQGYFYCKGVLPDELLQLKRPRQLS